MTVLLDCWSGQRIAITNPLEFEFRGVLNGFAYYLRGKRLYAFEQYDAANAGMEIPPEYGCLRSEAYIQ